MSRNRLHVIHVSVVSVLLSGLLLTSTMWLSTPAQAAATIPAATTITVDATQRYQTIQGLGVNANAHSWNNGQLIPALDQLTDQMGATAFRVVIDNADWEATNDDSDPNHFNWDYYNTVYESTKFTDLWNTIAYLNSKHVTVSISVMGPLAPWMGGSSLLSSEEPEWVEMMASLIYYGRVTKGLHFTLFEPFNEPDWNGIEGTQAGATQVARVMHALGVRLDGLGLSDVKFILPDTAGTGNGLGSYFSAMQGDSYLMGKVAALGLHDYSGQTGGADSVIKSSAYPALPFWMTEFSTWCFGCDNGEPNPADWAFANMTAQYMMNNLSQGAAGAEVWEGYDSYYLHHNSWSYWGLLAYDQTAGTYSPRKQFYAMSQFMRFIPPGSVRIGASSNNGNVSLLAFHDPTSGRVTLVGRNTSTATETVSGRLTGIDGLTSMAYYRTNVTANMEHVGDIPVTAGQFSTTVPGDTLFTFSGDAGPDTTRPTVTLTAPKSGATVAGMTQLAATASDDRGVTRVEFTVDDALVGSATQAPYQLTWDARTVAPGTHTIAARAFDAAGNNASNSTEVTVVADTTPPSTPTGLAASTPIAGQVALSWQPSTDNIAVAGYRMLRDGAVIGSTTTTAYVDATVTSGHTYSYTVEARDTSDNVSPPSTPVTVTIESQAGITVDITATTHQTTAAATITSPVFSTTKAGDLLVAFVGSDGTTTAAQSFRSVTGGGLTWRLRQRANAQAGTAEIWTAVAPATLTNVQVTATRAGGSYLGSLTVVAFSGANTVTDGATAGASAATGAPSVPLTTTGANAWVWGVGHDWDRAVARGVPANQELVDQYLASVGDTFWVQRLKSPTPIAGTTVTLNDTAPTTDRWNLAAIEVLPGGAPPPDTTPPTVSITAPAEGANVSGTTSVTASASDNVGVSRVEFYVDGTLKATDDTAPYTFSWNTTTVSDGQHQLTAKAYDAAGNVGTSSPAVTVTVDNGDHTPPSAPTNLSATATSATVVQLSWTASTDNVGVTGYTVIRDETEIGTATTTSYRDTSVKSGTTYTYTVTAFDAAGNASAASTPATVTTPPLPDTIAPTVNITAPAEGATVSGTIPVTATASDNVGVSKVEFYLDGTLIDTDTTAPYTYDWNTTTTSNGSHRLTAMAYDDAGNVGTSESVTVIVDHTPPTVAITAPTNGATISGTTSVTATASDNVGVARVEFYVDGTSTPVATDDTAPYTFSWNTTTVPDGQHQLTAKAYDAAGNVGTSSPAVSVTVANADTSPPTVAITAPTDGAIVSGTTTVTAAATDNVGVTKVEFYVDGALKATDDTVPYAFDWNTTTASNAAHVLTAKAYDAAGNIGTSPAVSVTIANGTTFGVDVMVFTHQSQTATTITSPMFSTTKAGDLLVAFASSDGPARGSQSFRSVTGGGLTWRLRQRANAQAGTAEIWTAVAPAILTNVQVTAATRARGSYLGSLTVVAFSGANTVTDGATAGASAATGAPSVPLTTTGANAWVWGVGHDWDHAVDVSVPTDQFLVDQYKASVGKTFWVQRLLSPTPIAGTTVTLNDTAPTTDRWNLAAIEVLPQAATRVQSKGTEKRAW